jgi:uncharacterized membrane protein YjgN (DUF898 family)
MADTCPKCGFASVDSDKCPQCGVLVSLYTVALEKFRLGNAGARSGAMPTVPRPAAPARHVTPAPGAPATNGSAGSRRLSFHGDGGTLFGILLLNMCLTLVTFGVYSFWAKVKIRQYFLAQTEIDRDRFAYHGTGPEVLRGFLKALLVFFLPMFLLQLAASLAKDAAVATAASALTTVIAVVFVPVAVVGSRRYRLSRTSWRAIRFAFDGGVREYVTLFLKGAILTVLTLGLYYPFFRTRSHAFLVSHSRFGQRAFQFDGTPRETFRPFLVAALLFVPTLGLSWVWHLAWRRRYAWAHTTFERARFRCTVTGGQLLRLLLGNALLLLVTFGVAWSWVRVRNARFALSTLSLEGPVDLAAILQAPATASATGDAISDFVGAGFDTGA